MNSLFAPFDILLYNQHIRIKEQALKRIAYHSLSDQKANEKLRQLQLELPRLCTDFFRSISQTTSALTRQAYAYDLRLFFRYLSLEEIDFAGSPPKFMSAEHMKKVTARHIEGFQEYLQYYIRQSEDKTKESEKIILAAVQNRELGIMRKLSSVRSFFDFLFRNEMIPSNVTALVSMPKRHSKPILFMETEEVIRMMDAIDSGDGFTKGHRSYLRNTRTRDMAIMMMFLGTGIRVSELVGLDLDHLNFADNSFMVTRKGGNQTILYFPDTVAVLLQQYLSEREKVTTLEGHEHALFLSLQKRRITQRAVENLVKKYALLGAPLKKKLSPHKLRSTFGTNLYQETGDIYLVADTLGHADVNTTRKHYAAMSDAKRREAAKRIRLPELKSNGRSITAENENPVET
jgi:integrase/recombinase XerC